MKRIAAFLGMLTLVFNVLVATSWGDPPEYIYHGGFYDGYDHASFLQMSSDDIYILNARFRGGYYDGFSSEAVFDVSVLMGLPAGTIFSVASLLPGYMSEAIFMLPLFDQAQLR